MTAYDEVAYPSSVFPATSPDRLACVARLHGLAAPDPATARILEIGGGDGMNAIAMAAAWPGTQIYNFDLSAVAIERGQAIVDACGLGNVRLAVGDIMIAADTLDGPFDYIIAHGVYAWVPEPVRDAVLKLIGRVLAPDGVAFVSYNALPGGHLRRALREMTLHEVGDIADRGARMTAAREFLAAFSQPREGDRPVLTGMRDVARPMSKKLLSSLFHDELGDTYAPQALIDVVAAARAHGLEFLNDASPAMLSDGLPREDLSDIETVKLAQASDNQALAFFHQTLLVRAGRRIARHPDPAGIASLYIASEAVRTGPESFTIADRPFIIGDARLADALARLAPIWPQRLPVADLIGDDPERLLALIDLHAVEAVWLYAGPVPGVAAASDFPTSSALARAMIAAGSPYIHTLDLRTITLEEAGPRAFLGLLDGSRDRAALARDWAATPYGGQIGIEPALAQLAAAALLLR